jgi:homoserine O-acetyltransferase
VDWATKTGRFALGELALQSGGTLPAAELSWKTYGALAPARDNVIVYPTSYSAQHTDLEWLIGPDGILDPTRWFIVIPDMFGNGLSSSPSTTTSYPSLITSADNVRAQQRLLREAFGVERIACVYGFSMGAQQAYHWAALYPDQVERAVILCGSARTSVHNKVFLGSLLATMSQDWYRAGLHLSSAGAATLDDFLDKHWEPGFTRRAAEDLYAQVCTWMASDISANELYDGDLVRALQAIRAHVLLMPSRTDLYFPVADNADEIAHLANAELRPIPSIWGHIAGAPESNPVDFAFVRNAVRAWLD